MHRFVAGSIPIDGSRGAAKAAETRGPKDSVDEVSNRLSKLFEITPSARTQKVAADSPETRCRHEEEGKGEQQGGFGAAEQDADEASDARER